MARADDIDDEAGADSGRTARTDAFWDELKIDPVEIALPAGVGYTLRAYRMSSLITATDTSGREEDIETPTYQTPYGEDDDLDFEEADDELADEDLEDEDLEDGVDEDVEVEEIDADVDTDDEATLDTEAEDDAALDAETADEADDEEALDEDATPDEEVPVFLSNNGDLLLFRTTESLVEFVKSGAPNDFTQLDEWDKLREGIRVEHIVAAPDDQYELDLVVNNLRGGPEVWDARLIVQSGQLARDVAYALRIQPVLLALSPGSPLDDLDEALRGVAAGGVGTFFAKRKARKIGKEAASLAWRTVIGKISAVVDWRD